MSEDRYNIEKEKFQHLMAKQRNLQAGGDA
jgi:hypothetical protein